MNINLSFRLLNIIEYQLNNSIQNAAINTIDHTKSKTITAWKIELHGNTPHIGKKEGNNNVRTEKFHKY